MKIDMIFNPVKTPALDQRDTLKRLAWAELKGKDLGDALMTILMVKQGRMVLKAQESPRHDPAVVLFQKMLNSLNYRTGKPIFKKCRFRFGFYDQTMEEAVKKFQRMNGLKVDGILDRKTLNCLKESFGGGRFDAALKLREDYLEIQVNIPAYRLYFYRNDELVRTCPITIGRVKHKSPVGEGGIYEVIERPVFRYLDPGPNKGKIIRRIELDGGKVVKMPTDMMAFGIKIEGETAYRIHSTINSSTLEKADSRGCFRVSRPNGVELKDLIGNHSLPVPITMKYQTIIVADRRLTVYKDVYGRGTNNIQELNIILKNNGINPDGLDRQKLEKALKEGSGKPIALEELRRMPNLFSLRGFF